MTITDITREAIVAAIREFDALGRQAFLDKYGFGRARGYYITHEDERYDSKAIVGAAHGFIGPGYLPLRAEDFSGGEKRVARLLRNLGFTVQTPNEAVNERVVPFTPGRIYHRQRDIHQEFGGQERGGISTPADAPFLFLFTGENGAQYGYRDGPMDDGSYAYCGEGQSGDQEFIRGNRAIRDHAAEGRDLLLFEAHKKKGLYRYLGCFAFAEHRFRTEADKAGQPRQVIVFHLVPVDVTEASEPEDSAAENGIDIEELRRRAYEAVPASANVGQEGTRTYYLRSALVKAYVLKRAKGICECCRQPAPFARADGSPYLEPHHLRRVSDGGPDHPASVAAVCPNCHRRVHHGTDGAEINERLATYIRELEGGLPAP